MGTTLAAHRFDPHHAVAAVGAGGDGTGHVTAAAADRERGVGSAECCRDVVQDEIGIGGDEDVHGLQVIGQAPPPEDDRGGPARRGRGRRRRATGPTPRVPHRRQRAARRAVRVRPPRWRSARRGWPTALRRRPGGRSRAQRRSARGVQGMERVESCRSKVPRHLLAMSPPIAPGVNISNRPASRFGSPRTGGLAI